MNGPTPRHLLHYVTRRLRLRRYLEDPGDGRRQPQIPAPVLLWALLVGQILRQSSFHAVEALVRSVARRTLSIPTPFSDDTLGYFTERLDPRPTRQALLSLIRGAKRNKAFDDCRWIGLAIDGTGAGWRSHQGCSLCRPQHNAQKHTLGYQHSFVMISVVGTGLSLPFDGEPYRPGDSEYAAGQRLLRRVMESVGKRFAQYVVVDGEFSSPSFLHTADQLGLRVGGAAEKQSAGIIRRRSATLAGLPPRSFSMGQIVWSCGTRRTSRGAASQNEKRTCVFALLWSV